jgi:hypothetical protein
MVARARICQTYQSGVDPDGVDLPILDGDVYLDATAEVRSTLDLVTDGTRMWPTSPSSLLAPYGNEVFVERGIDYGNGQRELVSLGYFRIYTPTQDEVPNGPIRIAARDRMSAIVDARLVAPVQYSASTTYGQVVETLVSDVLPDVTIEWDDDTDTDQIGRSVISEDDRYQFLDDLVKAAGKVWYFDHRGILVIRDPPDPASPVVEISGGEGGVLVSMSRELSRDGAYNVVVATGEGADTDLPARGVAYDNNPASPTYWRGRFGQVPRFFSSPLLVTNAQARQAAEALLRQSIGTPYMINFAAVPNPALEPLDPVRIRYSGRDTAETHVLETLTIPLTATQEMTATTREQGLVVIGSGV